MPPQEKRTQKNLIVLIKRPLQKDDYCSKTEYWKDGNIWVVKKNYK